MKGVLLDGTGVLRWEGAASGAGLPLRVLGELLEQLAREVPLTAVRVALTGRLRALLASALPQRTEVPDVAAVAAGAYAHCPRARDVLSLGGQYSLWCRLAPERPGDWVDFAISDLCAAGAGSFLEQQAGRLGLTLEELSTAASAASRAPAVAGRCAVFTKSDVIHLQQKGTPLDQIALGLCFALVRTFQAQVLQGRRLETPIVLVGGCALNRGMVRAVREVFGLDDRQLVVAERPVLVAAGGAARLATAAPLPLDELCAAVRAAEGRAATWSRTSPLAPPIHVPSSEEPRGEALTEQEVILGVDVGSVSTNFAIVDLEGVLLDCAYVKTQGRPVAAIEAGVAELAARHSCPLRIVAAGTTGSGRYLAGHLLGADLVKNEIAAQLRAAVAFLPEVDTVLEIGGQDAKYIRAQHGVITDFAMNRVCAAGTGSFLEEQAERLDIAIVDEFAARALAARAPVDLGRRCTVFMESEAVAALAAGATVEDVTAGLALSVARNYLERVVGDRPLGEAIVFQGGTASNRAVVAAFEQLLGRPIRVHPYRRVSGALGMALLLLDARRAGRLATPSRFRGLAPSVGELERAFECPRCSARCQVTRFRAGSERFHFGDACERYSTRDQGGAPVSDPLARRTELLLAASGVEEPATPPPRALGLLRASHTLALLPWYAALVRAAGRVPYLSPPTTTATLAAGMQHVTSDTCLPIRAAYGHAAELAAAGVEQILVPSVGGLPGDEGLANSCLFAHHLPFMLAGALAPGSVIAPELSLDLPRGRRVDALASAAADLGLSPRSVERALREGDAAAKHLRDSLEAWGQQVLAAGHDRVVVVLARPYLLSDPALNLGLGRHLARIGLPVLPLDALPLGAVPLDDRWADLPWHFTRDLIRAAALIRADPRLFPLVVSSFGCGPDAFTVSHLKHLFTGRPHLLLELDEHRSEAGLVTRLEAFADEISTHLEQQQPRVLAVRAPRPKIARHTRIVVPHFADHAYGQAGVLRAAGFEVQLLPRPTRAIRERGESLVSGRECHPFAMLAGDLAVWLERGDVRPDDVFFLPGTVVSCLLRQYGDGLDLLLQRLGAPRIRIVMPSLDSWANLIGTPRALRMLGTLVTTDLLLRARCRIRPYELVPGRTDDVYQQCLEQVGSAAERGGLFATAATCAQELATIPRAEERRPRIGVCGDAYTRVNDFASDNLFATLEAAGCEVWPAPFGADLAEYNATWRRQIAWRLGRPRWGLRAAVTARVIGGRRRRLEQLFRCVDGLEPEPDIPTLQDLVRPYLGSAANPLLILNVGRMLFYARGGAEGILNASCINCMVGSVSQACQDRLRRDLAPLPMTTLVYGGSDGATNQARLEAFVHQVRSKR